MDALRCNIVNADTEKYITIYDSEKGALSVQGDHPNFDYIVAGALRGDRSVIDLMDPAAKIAVELKALSERVTTAYGRIFIDGDEVHGAIASLIARFVVEGVEDYKPYVRFLEKTYENPSQNSREQLPRWLETNKFTVTEDGDIVGFKGVQGDGTEQSPCQSNSCGTAFVDNVKHIGNIPNAIGTVVTMPRNEVVEDPQDACSTGLHVGTWSYAKTFAYPTILEVHVHPRDVVSVPFHGNGEKVRVCRYKVVGIKPDGQYDAPVLLPKTNQAEVKVEKTTKTSKAPSPQAFTALAAIARCRKKGVATLAKRKGWVLVNEDAPKERLSWLIPS